MPGFPETEFVVLDVETTGLSPRLGDRIVEIAALKIRGLQPAAEFHSLVNPRRPVPWRAVQFHGITDDMLSRSPSADEVLPSFLEFAGEAVLVGHNLRFDLGFLDTELSRSQLKWKTPHSWVCTAKMARRLLPELGRYPLWALARHFDIETLQQHRALSDVTLTFAVFLKLLQVAGRRDIDDVFNLSRLFGRCRCVAAARTTPEIKNSSREKDVRISV